MMHLPDNSEDFLKAGVAITVIVGAVVIQVTNQDIPVWLATALSGVVSYYFGFVSNRSK